MTQKAKAGEFDKSTKQSGFAIVAAVWLAGVAMVIAVEFASRIRLNLLLTNQYTSEVALAAAAAGMMRLTALRTANDPPEIARGQTELCTWDAETGIAVELQDHSGLIDLNAGSVDLFQSLLRHKGIADSLAASLATEIVDYRDADMVSASGLPEPTLRDGGRMPNQSFQTVEEIDQLPSMTDETYVAIKDLFTIYSGQAGVDPQQLTRDFEIKTGQTEAGDSLMKFAIASPRRSYRIRIIATQKERVSYQIISNIVVLQQPSRPFAILTWNEKMLESKTSSPATPPVICFN